MDTCAFCGVTGIRFKPEHWLSQWISRATIGKGIGVEHHVHGREPWIRRIVELTVPHVCDECNGGWMSDIETRSRNVVLPLIKGNRVKLNRVQQGVVATWCFLKVITMELGRPEGQPRTYPTETYEGFKLHKFPPEGSLVTLGFRDVLGDPPMFIWFKSEGRSYPVPGVGDVGGYRSALTIGHLVIDVIGLLDPRVKPETENDDRLVQVWPVQAESLDWPPARGVFRVVNDDLA